MEYLILIAALIIGYISINSIIKNNSNNNCKNNDQPLKPKKNRYDELRNEYIKIHKSSNRDAVYKIDKHIELLKRTYPGQSVEWYVNRSIEDLKKKMF